MRRVQERVFISSTSLDFYPLKCRLERGARLEGHARVQKEGQTERLERHARVEEDEGCATLVWEKIFDAAETRVQEPPRKLTTEKFFSYMKMIAAVFPLETTTSSTLPSVRQDFEKN